MRNTVTVLFLSPQDKALPEDAAEDSPDRETRREDLPESVTRAASRAGCGLLASHGSQSLQQYQTGHCCTVMMT